MLDTSVFIRIIHFSYQWIFGLLLRNSADWDKAEVITCLVQANTVYSGVIVRIFVMAPILYIVSQQIHIDWLVGWLVVLGLTAL